jgi:hypothetical protein
MTLVVGLILWLACGALGVIDLTRRFNRTHSRDPLTNVDLFLLGVVGAIAGPVALLVWGVLNRWGNK